MKRTKNIYLALLAVLLSPMAANAAFISIDDSDPNTITITVNDFEGCFSVNGVELSCGLNDPQSITLEDGIVWSYSGSWIDLGQTVAGFDARYFGLGADVFSGVEVTTLTDGFFGTVSGLFTGFDSCCNYGPNISFPPSPQDGSTRHFSQPFLQAFFVSEAVSVPEPGTLALLGLGLAGMGMTRRKKKV